MSAVIMKQKWIQLLTVMVLSTGAVYAQSVSDDSIKSLKNNDKMLHMAISINDQKLQLAKMQNELAQMTYEAEKAAAASQEAASKNEDAAATLNNDDQDKQKANAVEKTAQTAHVNSSKARNAQKKMAKLTKDVRNLEKRIADNEQELIRMGGERYVH